MLTLFRAIGKFIDDCGKMNIAVESEIMANDTADGFVTGKHFNRCKRLHSLMALGWEILCFQSSVEKEKSAFIDNNESVGNIIEDKISTLVTQYQSYTEECREYYQLRNLSISTRNFSLCKYILSKIASILLPINLIIRDGWSKYHDNLLKVGLTHPCIAKSMKEGCLGIKRTAKSFSREPIDLVIEQTINADVGKN